MARKQTDIINLKLRLSESLRRRLEKAAERSGRSMNAEIIHRLEQSFEPPPPLDLFPILQKALEESRRENGDNPQWSLPAVGRPLRAALEQLLPDLHSLQISVFNSDGSVMPYTAYSERGWSRENK